ncbi:MAG: hypothetical protein WD057_03765 [Aquisalimonadaceae bacterium]
MDSIYPGLMIDGHVHVYRQFNHEHVFEAAARNFRREARLAGCDNGFLGVLMLTESAGYDWFSSLRSGDASFPLSGWRMTETSGSVPGILATATDRSDLLIVPGRQVITSERIEVLLLGTTQIVEDGLALDSVLARADDIDAVPVLPWAVGKWLGRRGSLVNLRIRETSPDQGLLLGDNSGRPTLWPRPRQLRLADRLGIHVLPGSDPLPLAGEEQRVGAFGAAVDAPVSLTDPIAELKTHLRNPATRLTSFGRLESNLRFLRNQIRLRRSRTSDNGGGKLAAKPPGHP